MPHERLLRKLSGYGVKGNLLNWIGDFLSNRTQFVKINDKSSSSIPVTSGVPQGSVLGPTLFVYYINDMPNVCKALLNIFADDTKTFSEILSYQDHLKLQDSLYALNQWSIDWLLGFNIDKCKVLHLGFNNPHHTYYILNESSQIALEANPKKVVDKPILVSFS